MVFNARVTQMPGSGYFAIVFSPEQAHELGIVVPSLQGYICVDFPRSKLVVSVVDVENFFKDEDVTSSDEEEWSPNV